MRDSQNRERRISCQNQQALDNDEPVGLLERYHGGIVETVRRINRVRLARDSGARLAHLMPQLLYADQTWKKENHVGLGPALRIVDSQG